MGIVAVTSGVNQVGREAHNFPPSSGAEVRRRGVIPPLPNTPS